MPSLERATVGDLMHPGVISYAADATAAEVARMMAIHNLHCVVVIGVTHDHFDDPLVWGLISDMDLTEMCITACPGRSAATLARRSILTVEKSTPIREAAALMVTERESHLQEAQHRVADRLVLAEVRGVFGERLQLALVGAATVAPELLEFFDACGVLVLEGYGLTETCAVATLNTPRALRFGTVGKPLPGTEVTIAPDGEILIRGPQVFKGYYGNPVATEEAMTGDGRLRSGDLGELTPDGFVVITGRKKDLIITSSGKNITPANLESALRETRYISEAVVFGDNRPYLVAIVTPNRDEVRKLANGLGLDPDPAALASDLRVRDEVPARGRRGQRAARSHRADQTAQAGVDRRLDDAAPRHLGRHVPCPRGKDRGGGAARRLHGGAPAAQARRRGQRDQRRPWRQPASGVEQRAVAFPDQGHRTRIERPSMTCCSRRSAARCATTFRISEAPRWRFRRWCRSTSDRWTSRCRESSGPSSGWCSSRCRSA